MEAAAVLRRGVAAARAEQELTVMYRASRDKPGAYVPAKTLSVRLVKPTAFLNASLETGIVGLLCARHCWYC